MGFKISILPFCDVGAQKIFCVLQWFSGHDDYEFQEFRGSWDCLFRFQKLSFFRLSILSSHFGASIEIALNHRFIRPKCIT